MSWIFIYISWFLLFGLIAFNKIMGVNDNYLIATAIMYASFVYIIIQERRDKK